MQWAWNSRFDDENKLQSRLHEARGLKGDGCIANSDNTWQPVAVGGVNVMPLKQKENSNDRNNER